MTLIKFFLRATIGIVVFTSCTSKDHMKLTGAVDGLKKGTLILQKIEDTTLISIDSIVVDGDANFQFEQEVKSPEMYFLYLRLKDGTLLDERIPFFAEAGEININTSLKKFANDVRISGSKTQLKYDEYQRILQRFNNQSIDLLAEEFQARKENNDSLADALQIQRERNLKRKYLASVNFAMNNNDSEIAPFIASTAIVDANKKYLDTIYGALTPRIKESLYGKKLKKLLSEKE